MKTEEMAEITPDEKLVFEKKLQAMLKELNDDSEDTLREMQNNPAHFPDLADQASVEYDQNLVLKMRDRERKLVPKIHKALIRLQDGMYNECEVCGEPIGKKRLLARPVTTLCLDCKEAQEEQERLKK